MISKPRAIDALLSLDLLPGVESGECPVCHVFRQRLHRYIDWFLIETYNAPPLLDRLADSGGFCPGHFRDIVSRTPSWQTWQMSFVTEVLIRHYLRLIEAVRRDLSRSWNSLSPLRFTFWKRLLPRDECPLCSDFRSWEKWVAEGLAILFADTEWSPRVSGAAVCVPHLLSLWRLGGASDEAKARAKALRDLEAAATAVDVNVDALRRFLCGNPIPTATGKLRPPFLRELQQATRSSRRPRRMIQNNDPQREATSLLEVPASGCPVCLLSQDADSALLASDRACRRPEQLCKAHLASLLARTSEQALRNEKLDGIFQGLAQLFAEGSVADRLPATCPACDEVRIAEEGVATWLAAGAERGGRAFARAGVICIRHLPDVVRRASPSAAALILQRQEAELRKITELLGEYHRKCDYRYKDEPKGEEQHAWRRALKVLAGTNEKWQSGGEAIE